MHKILDLLLFTQVVVKTADDTISRCFFFLQRTARSCSKVRAARAARLF